MRSEGRRPRRRLWLEARAGPQGQPVRTSWPWCTFSCGPFNGHSSAGVGDSLTHLTAGLPPSRPCPAGLLGNSLQVSLESPRCTQMGAGYANSFIALFTHPREGSLWALGIRGPAPFLLLAPGIGRLPRAWSPGCSPPPHTPSLGRGTGQSRLPGSEALRVAAA